MSIPHPVGNSSSTGGFELGTSTTDTNLSSLNKRKREIGMEAEGEGRKSKNSRFSPRQSAGQALNNLVNTLNTRSDSTTMMMMMQMQRDTMMQMMQMFSLVLANSVPRTPHMKKEKEPEDKDKN